MLERLSFFANLLGAWPANRFLGPARGRFRATCGTLDQADPRLIAIGKLDPSYLKGAPNYVERCAPRLTYTRFELVHGHNAYARAACELLLAPAEQPPRGPTLSRREHPGMFAPRKRFPQFHQKSIDCGLIMEYPHI